MHPRVESFPKPQPDYRNFLAAVQRRNSGPVPLVELAVDPEVIAVLLDQPLPRTGDYDAAEQALAAGAVQVLHRLGYDVVKMSAPIPFGVERVRTTDTAGLSRGTRQWQDQHHGRIETLADFERFHWPEPGDLRFGAFEAATAVLPDGMALLGFCGGVFECACDLMGLERFMYAIYDAPDLVAAVLDRVGRTILYVFEAYCQMDAVCALWLGDDLGSKNGLLVSPDLLQAHVFPWYARYRELAHRHGRAFLLHSCGNIESVMPQLVHQARIDAKHSFEDTIMPVEQFLERWGAQVGTLGGLDVNLLAQGPLEAIVARTRRMLEVGAPTRAYACGSGNSIPNYVSPEHYLAMVETVARWNGRL